MRGHHADTQGDRSHADPQRQHQLLEGGVEAGGGAHPLRGDLVIGDGVVGGELERHEEAASRQHREDRRDRPGRAKKAANGVAGAGDQAVDDQAASEPEPLERPRGQPFHAQRTYGAGDGDRAAGCGAHAKPQLQHHRQQERLGALGNAGQGPADHRKPEGRNPHKRQVEDRLGAAPRMADVERPGDQAHGDQGQGPAQLARSAGHLEAEQQAAQRQPRQHEADQIRPGRPFSAHLADELGDQHHPQHADRQIEVEDPSPVQVGDDEAAQRRADDRADQGRNDQP